VDEKTATEISKLFAEIVIAPAYSIEAMNILTAKKNVRIMQLDDICHKSITDIDIKKVGGGLLIQDTDWKDFDISDIKNVTDRIPTDKEMQDMLFAWKVVKHVKSNAIVVAKDGMTLGIGPGQTNRIWPTEMSLERAGEKAKGAVIASDAFFPFNDVVIAAAKAGISAVIQPGGAKRDQDSIDECNKIGIAMIFTGMRHFKH
jgi:phosphoribosylaminoimidazolecarboxamide formyltransferase/IMP cyclohydrolase